MREIKFRAWVKDEKKMVEVLVLTKTSIGYDDCGMDKVEFDDENYDLMQFTGLYDKNGKEIYEGDIVNLFGGTMYFQEVFWSDEDCCFSLRNITLDFEIGMGARFESQIEVIGNIYENPELLEVEK